LRFGAHDRARVMARADLVLRDAGGFPAEVVLRFGAAPVSKAVGQWAALCPQSVVVSGDPAWPDPSRRAGLMIHGDSEMVALGLAERIAAPAPAGWLERFRRAEDAATVMVRQYITPEAAVVAALLDALPEDALLFVGNSMAVRELDAFSGTSAKRLTVLGNRGLSGIDGNLSTFFGAAASGRFSRAVALVGDLTFLHDLGGLAAGTGIDAAICVLDNGGGGIFEYLPQAALPEFRQGWLTPQAADLAAAARVWGHAYHRCGLDDLDNLAGLATRLTGVAILHLAVDRDDSVRRHRALWADAARLWEMCR
jgi:2-succinyl-5-enolpyruvyl-6-hydroxy-3-cyclohexene-1-carboxylate synthase